MSNDRLDLYRRHRPASLEAVVGQPDAVALLRGLLREGLPHAMLFSGQTGTGKTTLAGILAKELGCDPGDHERVNAADEGGVDKVREAREMVDLLPAFGRARCWTWEEAQRLTQAGQATLLDLLETLPSHVYFFFTTTDPDKLLPALRRGRLHHVALRPLPAEDLRRLLARVCKAEGATVTARVLEEIAEAAGGSAREALTLLEDALPLGTEEAQLNLLASQEATRAAGGLGALLLRRGATWREAAEALAALGPLTNEGVEEVRYGVLKYAAKALLKDPPSARAAAVIHRFECSWKESGPASLAKACYELLVRPEK